MKANAAVANKTINIRIFVWKKGCTIYLLHVFQYLVLSKVFIEEISKVLILFVFKWVACRWSLSVPRKI